MGVTQIIAVPQIKNYRNLIEEIRQIGSLDPVGKRIYDLKVIQLQIYFEIFYQCFKTYVYFPIISQVKLFAILGLIRLPSLTRSVNNVQLHGVANCWC